MKDDEKVPLNLFGSIKRMTLEPFASTLLPSPDGDEQIPGLLEAYVFALKSLSGLSSVKVQVGDLMFVANTKGMDIFSLFPSEEELKKYEEEHMKPEDSEIHKLVQKYLRESSVDSLGSSSDILDGKKEDTDTATLGKETSKMFSDDGNGIVQYFREDLRFPPKALSSSLQRGVVTDFINPGDVYLWTLNLPNSWFMVDFGSTVRVIPTKYSYKYGSSGSYCCPRNWMFQGAVTLSSTHASPTSSDWTTLSQHVNDKSINESFGKGEYDVPDAKTKVGYRYFRIIQTGPNCFVPSGSDEWSNVLVASGFEVWGHLKIGNVNEEVVVQKTDKPASWWTTPGTKDFTFAYANDTNGVISGLTKAKQTVDVKCSSVSRGTARDFIQRGEVYCWTQNKPFSWYMVDLGPNFAVQPNYYTFRYGSGGNGCCPRNWLLQGAETIKDEYAPVDAEEWTTLSSHKNDATLNSSHATLTVALHGDESYRYFRIIQTGPTSFTGGSGWKDVLVASGFEIYGILTVKESAVEPEL
jgi:hypothetical protein